MCAAPLTWFWAHGWGKQHLFVYAALPRHGFGRMAWRRNTFLYMYGMGDRYYTWFEGPPTVSDLVTVGSSDQLCVCCPLDMILGPRLGEAALTNVCCSLDMVLGPWLDEAALIVCCSLSTWFWAHGSRRNAFLYMYGMGDRHYTWFGGDPAVSNVIMRRWVVYADGVLQARLVFVFF
ncbi:unnamed protein product [Thelazia callipaeda]|uniref:Genome assembly, chromosome: II n=1 Tax=Thelazia callipaeda TaxID=103827 RepID=A0A0N5CTM6_THECL|nr:unnamed protein product [Thelazia callipaeda]